MEKCEENLALSRKYGGKVQEGRTLLLMAKIRMKEACYEEALPYAQEAAQIFKETGSRHLPEAEAALTELQELKFKKNSG